MGAFPSNKPSSNEQSRLIFQLPNVLPHVRKWWRNRFRLFLANELPIAVVTSLAASGVVIGLRELGILQPFELMVFDQMVQFQPDRGADPRLLVVSITEADIRSQKQWPLSDQVIAQAMQNLQQYQPRAIGLDIFRDIPNEPGNKALQAQLKQPNVVVINYIGNNPAEGIPAPAHLPDAQVGASDIVSDADGVVRRNLMFVSDGKTTYTSFAVQLALMYLQQEQIGSQVNQAGDYQIGHVVFPHLLPSAGGYQAIDTEGYQTLLKYRSANNAVHQVTLQQVLQQKLAPEWVRDKIVLIGVTAASAKDMHFTPYSAAKQGNRQMPGVVLHAQMLSQVLDTVLNGQPLPWYWSDRWEMIWIVACAVIGSSMVWRTHHWFVLILAGSSALMLLAGVSFALFIQGGWVPVVAPALAMVIAGSGIVAYKVFHDAFHDGLTGLPNRALFLKRLRQAAALQKRGRGSQPSHRFAVLFLDLDRFKVVNDNLGHRIGDQLLLSTRDRLRACLKFADTLARVGGDEFAILLRHVDHLDAATELANQLQAEMAIPFLIKNQRIFTSVSIGIALNQMEGNSLPEDLLRDAHTAMYQAKALGKSRQEVFATGMRVQVVRRLQLETDLRRAIEHQEFQLYYQPIISLETGMTAGFEALVRWHHPQNGFISPVEFIPVAEESGLIIPLGQWILQAACTQLKRWQTLFDLHPPLIMSVNLSGQQFTQPDLVEFIEQTLVVTGIDGHSLKLEITESVAMNDVEAAIAMLNRLKALNLQLSIDDFGTGYSSLSYLHRFPVDTLKVDRSFVSRMDEAGDDAAIVQTILGLAHSLGMNVVAEGVETAAQLARLQALGCEYGQGYFFAKPLPDRAAEELLETKIRWLERQ